MRAQDPTCLAILHEIDAQVGIGCRIRPLVGLLNLNRIPHILVFRAVLKAKDGR